jgi:hypothetical protein
VLVGEKTSVSVSLSVLLLSFLCRFESALEYVSQGIILLWEAFLMNQCKEKTSIRRMIMIWFRWLVAGRSADVTWTRVIVRVL